MLIFERFVLYFTFRFFTSFSPLHFRYRLRATVGGLAFGRGNTKARTGDKLSNSSKTFCEHTPRLTPNRLLCVRASFNRFTALPRSVTFATDLLIFSTSLSTQFCLKFYADSFKSCLAVPMKISMITLFWGFVHYLCSFHHKKQI